MTDLTLLEEFLSNVETDWECMIWTGVTTADGHPRFYKSRSFRPMASRWIMKEMCGVEVKSSEVVTPLCGRRLCVNPDHLKVMSRGDFIRNRPTVKSIYCSKGHDKNGESRCRECASEAYMSKYRDKAIERQRILRRVNKESRQFTPTDGKVCSKCEKSLPDSNFYLDKSRSDWLSAWCKTCVNAANADRRTTPKGRSVKRACNVKRKARLRNLGPMRNDLNVLFTLAYGELCVKCGVARWTHVDHIIPASVEGSSNSVINLQPLCEFCNLSKGNRESVDYRPFEMTDELADRLMKGKCGN